MVADDGFDSDVDAELVEPRCQPEGVRVDAIGRDELTADGNDLRRSQLGRHMSPASPMRAAASTNRRIRRLP